VWKMPADGGNAVQVTKKGGYVARESPDGHFLYYSKAANPGGLWKVPVGGGAETEVFRSLTFQNFAVASDRIYFIPRPDTQGHYSIYAYTFATGKSSLLSAVSGELGYGIAVSPDGKTLLYSQIDRRGSDLMLVDNLR